MAKPTTLSFSKLIVMIQDPDTPAAYIAPCGLTTRGINFTKETNDVNVPDCDDPDAPSWLERGVVSISGTITGEGVLAVEAFELWRDTFLSTDSKPMRMLVDTDSAVTGGHFSGNFHMTTFNLTGEPGEKIGVEVEFISDGEIIWTLAA